MSTRPLALGAKSCLMLALILTSCAFAEYADAPFSEVKIHNDNALANIHAIYPSLSEQRDPTFEDPIIFAGGKLLLLFPSIDDRISSNNETTLYWVWSRMYANKTTNNQGIGCPDDERIFENSTISGLIVFNFRNMTRSIDINGAEFTLENPFTKEELSTANGTEQLEIVLGGTITFNYTWKKHVNPPLCIPVEQNIVFNRSFSDQQNYTVESGEPLFFLVAPVLKEQWYKNNHFDNVVLSKRMLLKGNITMNNNTIEPLASFGFYKFNISQDEYGIQRIYSFKNATAGNMTAAEFATVTVPNGLAQGNKSFAYVYSFNSSYSGLGENTLGIGITDHFGNRFEKTSTIASRMLTYDGDTTEIGAKAAYDENKMRKSASPISYVIENPVVFAVLGVLIIAFLAFNRLIRKRAG